MKEIPFDAFLPASPKRPTFFSGRGEWSEFEVLHLEGAHNPTQQSIG